MAVEPFVAVLRPWAEASPVPSLKECTHNPRFTLVEDVKILLHLFKCLRNTPKPTSSLQCLQKGNYGINRTPNSADSRYRKYLYSISKYDLQLVVRFIKSPQQSYLSYATFTDRLVIQLQPGKNAQVFPSSFSSGYWESAGIPQESIDED